MTDKIKELKEQLAKAELEESKKAGFTVVVFDENLEELKEIKVKPHELNKKEKVAIMEAAGNLSDNMGEIEKMGESIDTNSDIGQWLKFMELIDEPLKVIIAAMFRLDKKIVATLPNIELLEPIFAENPWVDEKAGKVLKELNFMLAKDKDNEK